MNIHTHHSVNIPKLRVTRSNHNSILSSLAPFEQNLPLEHLHQQHIRRLPDEYVRLRDYSDAFLEQLEVAGLAQCCTAGAIPAILSATGTQNGGPNDQHTHRNRDRRNAAVRSRKASNESS
jgi:hypothetical protein